jgi:putative PIN family toxin of toxin-antitoxin system
MCWFPERSFGGVPGRILEAWKAGAITLVVSPAILDEYHRVGRLLEERYEGAELDPFLALLAVHAEVVDAPDLPETVCEDSEDDKFLSCALAGAASVVVSGDKHLRRVSGWKGIEVMAPRAFLNQHIG